MATNLPYIAPRKNRRGEVVYYYYRRDGRLVARIEDRDGRPLLPGQRGFLDAYDAIHSSYGGTPGDIRTGTVARLVAKFRGSYEFNKNIGEGSRYQYGLHMRYLEEEFGDLQARKLTSEIVSDMLDDLQDTARKANYLRTTISRLWNFGKVYSEFGIKENPVDGVVKLKQGKGWRAWKDDELARFMGNASPMMRTTAALAVYTGQRRGDLASMLWSQFDGTAIEVMQEKTRNKVWIPAHSQLRAALVGLPRQAATILVTREGKSFTAPYLGKAFTAAMKQAKLPAGPTGCHLHGLRKTAGVKLAEAGCTAHEIMAILGCSMANAEYYSKEASQKKLARSAMAKMESR